MSSCGSSGALETAEAAEGAAEPVAKKSGLRNGARRSFE
jgi:hypothetical protein